MPKSRNRKKVKKRIGKKKPDTYIFQYYSLAFQFFHSLIADSLRDKNIKYRLDFWENYNDGAQSGDTALGLLNEYKAFIENLMKEIIQKYSISYWLHVSRRIAPSTMGDDFRHETIEICRNIIAAAIQKYAMLGSCGKIRLLNEIAIGDVFNGLLLTPDFAAVKRNLERAPIQLVLTDFDKTNLLEYYDLERLAFELWYAGSKSRVIAKGADLIVDHNNPQVLLDNRSSELSRLISNFDERSHGMIATATGTVFGQSNSSGEGTLLITQIFTDRSLMTYSDPVTKRLNIKFPKYSFPNYEFVQVDIRAFLHVHLEYSDDFLNKWGVRLEFVIAVITDICLTYMSTIINDKDIVVTGNMLSRSYQIFKLDEFKKGIADNWKSVIEYLKIQLEYDELEVQKTISYLTLDEINRKKIYVDTFGPLKLFVPGTEPESIFIDHSLIGQFLYNLFYDLPLTDRKFKGQLLEDAVKIEGNYLPVTQSKALDGTSKQVDFSFIRGDILVLVECKAVARSFGIFGGQTKAIEHRNQNVIDKGLNDIDLKIEWFLKHPKGTNYDLSHLKYIVGIVVSPFSEFIYSLDDKYWLNNDLPRVLNIEEFKDILNCNLKAVIKKNLIQIK